MLLVDFHAPVETASARYLDELEAGREAVAVVFKGGIKLAPQCLAEPQPFRSPIFPSVEGAEVVLRNVKLSEEDLFQGHWLII